MTKQILDKESREKKDEKNTKVKGSSLTFNDMRKIHNRNRLVNSNMSGEIIKSNFFKKW